MAQSAKFLFDYSFDERAEADAAKPDAAALAKQAQLQAEHDAAFARGRETGLAEAAADIAQCTIDATTAMVEQLASLEKVRAEIERSTTDAAIRLAIAVLRKLLPSFEQRSAMTEIEVVFSECLQRMLEEPRLVLRVPDDLLDAMRARVDENVRKAGFQGKVVLLADGGLGPSDCRIEWADGGAERNVERIWNDVEELVRRALDEPQKTTRESAPAAAPTT
jgi:flagellar assembly protein FliH